MSIREKHRPRHRPKRKLHHLYALAALPILLMCGESQAPGNNSGSDGCPGATYPAWSTSDYVLPYEVGTAYSTDLTNCSGSFHAEGLPDEFALDFSMQVGTIITASRAGIVVHVVESGSDFNQPNNLVVVDHGDGTFAQYMHLTQDGADVETGDAVQPGDAIGRSGATGLAGYPHLHLVVTQDDWSFPYTSIPVTFRNTSPNPRSLVSGQVYTAEPY